MTEPVEILRKYWGHSHFREMQEDIIRSVLADGDTLALLPTGGGKSICFQVPALVREGLCIVVSPLIALMKDQVARLRQMEIRAVAIYSGMSPEEIDRALDNSVHGHYKLLYVSPERLLTEILKVRAPKMKVNLLAIDEAHCISQWGYDFRPPYLQIAAFRKLIPEVPVLALTATATPDVVKDICRKLEFRNGHVFQKSFLRSNLSYSVLFEENKFERLTSMLKKVPGTALVYVRNRRRAREISEFLKRKKISADYYHAGLDHATRSEKQERWTQNKIRVMICTNAFGMGIDKPDVRLVVHWDVPNDQESYFQEAGRAGRDEKKSFAVLLYNKSDLQELQERLVHGIPSIETLRKTYQALANYYQLAIGAGAGMSFDFDLGRFSKTYQLNPVTTHEAISILSQEGYLSATDSVYLQSRLFMCTDRETLYRFEVENRKFEAIIRTLMRSYSGIFEDFVPINELEIARHLSLDRSVVIRQLKELSRFNLLRYEPLKDAPQLVFLKPREDAGHLDIDFELLRKRRAAHERRLTMMKRYVENVSHCRSVILLDYFGEKEASRCGICDVCLKRNQLDLTDLEFDAIGGKVVGIIRKKPMPIPEVVKLLREFKEQHTLKTIQFLLDQQELSLNARNQLILRS